MNRRQLHDVGIVLIAAGAGVIVFDGSLHNPPALALALAGLGAAAQGFAIYARRRRRNVEVR